jgi:hypothetical protein
MGQVIGNLASYAVKYSPVRGMAWD